MSTMTPGVLDFGSLHRKPLDELVEKVVTGALVKDSLVMNGVMKKHENLASPLKSNFK